MDKKIDEELSTASEITKEQFSTKSHPFDDPVQRTRCLIQYIRLRKQRAEKELAKRNALRKQKKDAQANLEAAKKGIVDGTQEIGHLEQRLEELEQNRYILVVNFS
jgi:uncharacterized protein YaaN involved in tellurite resistance